jgi:hypothetical protein
MGVWKPFHSSSSCCCNNSEPTIITKVVEVIKEKIAAPKLPNPNPYNFQIIYWEEHKEKYTIAEIIYPDCTNYEGHKICVYETTHEKLSAQEFLDPHFCNNSKHLSPIARFVPTEKGLQMAQALVKTLLNEE